MMLKCGSCGGRLEVVESHQTQMNDLVSILRKRKCQSCGLIITSQECIRGALVRDNYRHKGGKRNNGK